MDIAKSKTFKNFIILNKALLFLIRYGFWFHSKFKLYNFYSVIVRHNRIQI